MVLTANELEDKSDLFRKDDSGISISAFFQCALSFLKISSFQKEAENSHGRGSPTFVECKQRATNELCFVKCYNDLNGNILRIDNIDRVVQYLRMQWTQTLGGEKHLLSRLYGLIPVKSISKGVLLVCRDLMVHFVSRQKIPFSTLLEVAINARVPWYTVSTDSGTIELRICSLL